MKNLTILFLLITSISFSQDTTEIKSISLLQQRIPNWVQPVVQDKEWCTKYAVSDSLNPFYLEGDFNGDKYQDIALHIVNKLNGKTGILIVHRNLNKVYILGAGQEFGMGDNMEWVNVWNVYREKVVDSYPNGKRKRLLLKNPAIQIIKTETISSYFYWAGNKYRTFNQVI